MSTTWVTHAALCLAFALCILQPRACAQDSQKEPMRLKPYRICFTGYRIKADLKTSEPVIVVELVFMDRNNASHHLRVGDHFDRNTVGDHVERFTVTAFRVRLPKDENEGSDPLTEIDLRSTDMSGVCTLRLKGVYNFPIRLN